MNEFLLGAMATAACIVALFFLRFWQESHDRLFALFAAAFFLLAVTRIGLAFFHWPSEEHTYLHWVRFVAFLLILIAIIDKNRRYVR